MAKWKRHLSASLLVTTILGCGDDNARETGENPATTTATTDGAVARRPDAGAVGASKPDASATSAGNTGDDGADCSGLTARIRDFSSIHGNANSNPDFEATTAGLHVGGLVEDTLGADNKPVFKSVGFPQAITSAATFAQWYNDTPGINIAVPYTIPLTKKGDTGTYEFSSKAFFPADNQGWDGPDSPTPEPMLKANDGKLHNFSFTTEVHTSFTYHGGEKFSFQGDDDLWIFINKKLALDLGGIHAAANGSIDFDDVASKLGITKGQTYPMDIFHAERHTSASNFSISTTIECFMNVMVI